MQCMVVLCMTNLITTAFHVAQPFKIKINWRPSHMLGHSLFYSKNGFWPSYCQISTDLDKILHTPIVVRNTLVGRFRPRLARGRLQAKPERLCFFGNTCNAP